MNIINIDNNKSININDNVCIKDRNNKYKIDLLKQDKLILIINNIDSEMVINVYDNFNLLLYGNIDNKLNIKINIYNGSKLKLNKITKNNNSQENIEINLDSNNSTIKFNCTYIGSLKSNVLVNHKFDNTTSNIVNHAATNNSDIIININETVENGIKNCKLKQYTKILKIDNSKVLIRPILNTRDYRVEAFHSSIVTNINKDDILYLMSRGLNESESIKLIMDGFIFSNIEDAEDEISKIKEFLDI